VAKCWQMTRVRAEALRVTYFTQVTCKLVWTASQLLDLRLALDSSSLGLTPRFGASRPPIIARLDEPLPSQTRSLIMASDSISDDRPPAFARQE
jgi:hypothetical protein